MTSFRNLESLFRRGDTEPLELLPPDPAAVITATHSLLLAGAGPDWWPYAVLVSPEMVAVHLAGAHCPAPRHPWRPGPDPRLWLSTRAEIQHAAEVERLATVVADMSRSAKGPRPVLLGVYEDGRVYIDVARAPGPLVVTGPEPWVSKVRELLSAQLPSEALAPGDVPNTMSEAYWPLRVLDANTISMLGCALAGVVKYPELMQTSMAERRSLQPPTSPAAAYAPALPPALIPTPPPAPIEDRVPAMALMPTPMPTPISAPVQAPRQMPVPAALPPPAPSPPPIRAPRPPAPPRRPAALPASVFEAPAASARAAESDSGPAPSPAYNAVPPPPPPRPAPPRSPVPLLPGNTAAPPVNWNDVAVSSAETD